ncbi:glycosyltransferase involved in cell wall biosynthesis [Ochrobactrum sp. 19YEA23]|uniref:glycosyltransferase n=1 Tax=Ochrobactrum sp. 19YEA23 TaxID=3039854 RepID=UPI00247A7F95|nr:glycosyltransferase involved in cell wall biosynthesis [Ochrobactrum sp. 19YEA23]
MKIGIFIAYHPNSELSNQGLGRLLRELTKGLLKNDGTEVALLCPSWLKKDVEELFSDVRTPHLSILAPQHVPALVTFRNKFSKKGKKKDESIGLKTKILRFVKRTAGQAIHSIEVSLATALSVRNPFLFLLTLSALAVVGVLLAPLYVAAIAIALLTLMPFIFARVPALKRLRSNGGRLYGMIKARMPLRHRPPLRFTIYDQIFKNETRNMISIADSRKDIDIWFSPTVFWPEFSSINAPTVQAFPDMLISEFPTTFALELAGSVAVFKRASKAIKAGKHFTSYSEAVGHGALSKRFDVDQKNIHVIPHAPINLSKFITVIGTLDDEMARNKFTTNLIHGHRNAKWSGDQYLSNFDFSDTQFIFYASQFRPNKNIMNLVKAFEIVLRKRHKYIKLIMTGNWEHAPEVLEYIKKKRLTRDILTAYNASDEVLAALYAKARLSVNPTLYEGGFPFTFAEGMSVGTPSLMSRIPQVTDVIQGRLAATMLFDPYSIDDIASKIEYGLDHRGALFDLQTPLYNEMRNRTWSDVAEDHIKAFQKVIEVERR